MKRVAQFRYLGMHVAGGGGLAGGLGVREREHELDEFDDRLIAELDLLGTGLSSVPLISTGLTPGRTSSSQPTSDRSIFRCRAETKRESSRTSQDSSRPTVKPAGESKATHWRLVRVF